MDKQNVEERWGRGGWLIKLAGPGGGVTLLPSVLDDYERALGLSVQETWLLKRLLRYYWHGGDDVFPSAREISRRANIGRATVQRLRDSLEAKGLVKVNGRMGAGDTRVRVNLAPLFDALVLCVLVDPSSKVSKEGIHTRVRRSLFADEAYGGARKIGESLPISLENARELAGQWGVKLDWAEVAKMQGVGMVIATKDAERYKRQLEVKAAIREGANETFSIRWSFRRAYELLNYLTDSGASDDHLRDMARAYAENLTNRKHSLDLFEAWARRSLVAQGYIAAPRGGLEVGRGVAHSYGPGVASGGGP